MEFVGRRLLRLMGFRVEGRFPPKPRLVVIGAPHTSNWDFVLTLAVRWALAVPARYLAKHTLFESPFGRLLKPLDVARLCTYLLSDESGILTGSCIDYAQRVMGVFPPEDAHLKK